MIRLALNGLFLDTPASGTGQYLLHLAVALAGCEPGSGVHAEMITSRSYPLLPISARTAPSHFPGDLGKLEFEQVTFPRECARGGYSLAHVPHWGPPIFSQVPVVTTIHDLIPLVLPEYRGSLLVRAYSRLAASGARRARFIIADSEASKRDIVSELAIREERVRVVYLAAEPRFRPVVERDELDRVRARHELPDHFILYLGGYDTRKNVPMLVHAFSQLGPEIAAGWKLVLAGRLPERDTAFTPDPLVGAGPGVQSIGFVDERDKPTLYSLASAVAFPSRYEGFGLVPLEAMACGTPVLVSRSSSLPEVVGDAGLLLDPLRDDEWTAALRAVMNDGQLRKELSQKGLAQAGRFSWDRTARETIEVYRAAKSFD